MEKTPCHFISNTHWDREWRYSMQRTRHMLVYMMDMLLDILENYPEFNSFHLDSQPMPIQDYLEIRPEKEEVIKKLVAPGSEIYWEDADGTKIVASRLGLRPRYNVWYVLQRPAYWNLVDVDERLVPWQNGHGAFKMIDEDHHNRQVDLINKYSSDILGTQEDLKEQIEFLMDTLTEYVVVGEGRKGGDDDEHMANFFRRDKFRLREMGTFQLSETPEILGSGPEINPLLLKDSAKGGRDIDWILCKGNVNVLPYEKADDNGNGAYPSDHKPILVEFQILDK